MSFDNPFGSYRSFIKFCAWTSSASAPPFRYFLPLRTADVAQRRGLCNLLTEALPQTAKETIQLYADQLVSCVVITLTDPLPSVRTAAAQMFDVLQNALGSEAVEKMMKALLRKLVRNI